MQAAPAWAKLFEARRRRLHLDTHVLDPRPEPARRTVGRSAVVIPSPFALDWVVGRAHVAIPRLVALLLIEVGCSRGAACELYLDAHLVGLPERAGERGEEEEGARDEGADPFATQPERALDELRAVLGDKAAEDGSDDQGAVEGDSDEAEGPRPLLLASCVGKVRAE